MRRPRTFAEYMATPEKRGQRDGILAMCDRMERESEQRAREFGAAMQEIRDRYDREDAEWAATRSHGEAEETAT